jgi:arylsulfatase A-like enzyme
VNGLMGLVNLGWSLPNRYPVLAQVLGGAGYETFLFGLQHEAADVRRLGFQHVSNPSCAVRRTAAEDVAPLVASFLADRGKSPDTPFYARVGFADCHRPWKAASDELDTVQVPTFLADTPAARAELSSFRAALEAMDRGVGRILDSLDASGLRDSTVVVFTTDHGPPFPRAKASLYDPGIQTAMIVRWPNGFRGGVVCNELLSSVDLFPTLLKCAGVSPPKKIQGRSFLSLLQGGAYSPRRWIFAEMNTIPNCVRRCVRTGRHKYIENVTPGPKLFLPTDIEASLVRRDVGNDHLEPAPPAELYDLQADPDEEHNVVEEPQHRPAREELESILRDIQRQTNDPALNRRIERPAGEMERLRQAMTVSLSGAGLSRTGLKTGFDAMGQSR